MFGGLGSPIGLENGDTNSLFLARLGHIEIQGKELKNGYVTTASIHKSDG